MTGKEEPMPRRKKRHRRWQYTAGARGHRVTVYEYRKPGDMIWGRIWDARRGRYLRRSLGHRDKRRAEAWALQQAQKLQEGHSPEAKPTLRRVINAYLEHRTATRANKDAQQEDRRRAGMWLQVLGGNYDPLEFDSADVWERFIASRRSGAINSSGDSVAAGERVQVGDRTVEADCCWLVSVLNFATQKRDGVRLLSHNPVNLRNLKKEVGDIWPHEENPQRPLASRDWLEMVRAAASNMRMEVRWNGKRELRASYLPEMLDLAWETGHRVTAICNLRYSDYLPDAADAHGRPLPYGALRWRAQHDKKRRKSIVPLNENAQAAILRVRRDRPGIGDAPMFPCRDDPMRPITRSTAYFWIRKAEDLAGVDHVRGRAWHSQRRTWATVRKNLPNQVDVAAAGGWKGIRTMAAVYQQPDLSGMYAVITANAELREKEG
jgi:hypothetical protein